MITLHFRDVVEWGYHTRSTYKTTNPESKAEKCEE